MKFIVGLILLFTVGCSGNTDRQTENSFYYWKTSFTSDSNTSAYIYKEHICHFYIHYFDVQWSDDMYMPVPVAEITGFTNAAPFIRSHFTPVIFITNKCIETMDQSWCSSLPGKIKDKITYITNKLRQINPDITIDEIQIDCDWTTNTKDKYFLFLKNFKQLFPDKIISATIRLYPYKYFEKAGVPPVDKGLLMCYNLTDIKNPDNSNSIFDIKDLRQYLVSKKYPLPLDIGLPIFGWYAWFRSGQYRGIIYPDGQNPDMFFKKDGRDLQVIDDTMIDNNYLKEGDVLRPEYPDSNGLAKAAELLHNKFPDAGRISIFYWDNVLIRKNEATIHKIFAAY